MADSTSVNVDENKTVNVICKCDLEYASVACNRTPSCLDWGRNGWVAFGACYSIALCCPKVRRCHNLVYHVFAGLSVEAGSRRKSAGCQTTLHRLVLPRYQLKRSALCLKSCFPFPDQIICYLLHVGHLSHKTFYQIACYLIIFQNKRKRVK